VKKADEKKPRRRLRAWRRPGAIAAARNSGESAWGVRLRAYKPTNDASGETLDNAVVADNTPRTATE
jgi:hypothetical protein